MTYSLLTDIESELRDVSFTSGPNEVLTIAEINAFLTQTEALINTRLSNRYELPIVGVASLLLLKKIEIDLVTFRVVKILNLKRETPTPDSRIEQDLNYSAAFQQSTRLLEELFMGKVLLPDDSPKTAGSGISSFNQVNNIQPVWERDAKQW